MDILLVLEDGTIFEGKSFGYEKEAFGEIVFNTGMSGYQEILTDSSYFGQIVVMTYPLIGNYGVNNIDLEAEQPSINGLIVRHACKTPSNFRSQGTLGDYMKNHRIPGVEGIDTRALTRIIRDKGTMKCGLVFKEGFDKDSTMDKIRKYSISNPVSKVTVKNPYNISGSSGLKVAVLDYGVKSNILKSMQKRGLDITVYPSDTDAKEILKHNYDGLILSNGPGNPKDCLKEIENLKKIIGRIPIFGICLGHQLAALAMGCDTVKLKYGHRGCNHPIKDVDKDRTYITSQNHGYVVKKESFDPDSIKITHININDGTIEGLKYRDIPLFTVQFHPEASPGPHDTGYLFDEFIEIMTRFNKGGQNA